MEHSNQTMEEELASKERRIAELESGVAAFEVTPGYVGYSLNRAELGRLRRETEPPFRYVGHVITWRDCGDTYYVKAERASAEYGGTVYGDVIVMKYGGGRIDVSDGLVLPCDLGMVSRRSVHSGIAHVNSAYGIREVSKEEFDEVASQFTVKAYYGRRTDDERYACYLKECDVKVESEKENK